jgi:hypothetical protein
MTNITIATDISNYIAQSTLTNIVSPRKLAFWKGSRYEGLAFAHPKQKGAAGERIVQDVCNSIDTDCTKARNTGHDRIIEGIPTEIKSSFCNEDTEKYSFLQIRPAQDYEQILFVTIHPDFIHMYLMSKDIVYNLIDEGKITPQHGGRGGNSGTFSYYVTERRLLEDGAIPFV